MSICWSPTQVHANRIRTIVSDFDNTHLPWCTFPEPYELSNCNCHSPNREEYLKIYAESIIEKQDFIAKALQGK